MKWLKYKKLIGKVNKGTEEIPVWENIVQNMGLEYSVDNEVLVKDIALDGEYIIEDDGQPNPVEEPSQLDVIEAQVTYTAMMTDTLLEV